MKANIFAGLALMFQTARGVFDHTAYLSWEYFSETEPFSDLGMNTGTNYQACSGNSVAVGLVAAGKHIQTVSLICGDIIRKNAGTTTNLDRSTVPNVGDAEQVMGMGRWLGGDNGANNTCPDGQMVVGASCTGNECTNMAIYCAAAGAVSTPHMTPDDGTPVTYAARDQCGWSDTIGAGSRLECPSTRVIAGLQCSGKRCSELSLYCCPISEPV